MGIDICFIKPPINSDTIGTYDSLNKDVIEKTVRGFYKESQILRKQDILVIFDSDPFTLIQSLASTFIKDTPPYEPFLYKIPILEYEIKNLSEYKFLIYLSRKVREGNDRIFKVFNIAHELQHVIQYIYFKETFLRIGVIQGYVRTINKYTNEFYRNIPTEIDAFRKSKKIASVLFGENEVDEFILKKKSGSKDDIERAYWENIEQVDVQVEYDLRNISEKIWNENKTKIDKKIRDLKNTKRKRDLNTDEKNFIEAYEFYQRETEGHSDF